MGQSCSDHGIRAWVRFLVITWWTMVLVLSILVQMHVEDILRGLERGIEATIETPYDATPFYGERIDEFHRSQLIPIPLWHAISADYLGCKPLTNDTNPPCTVNFAKTSDFLILHTSAKIVTQATQEKTSTIYSSS